MTKFMVLGGLALVLLLVIGLLVVAPFFEMRANKPIDRSPHR